MGAHDGGDDAQGDLRPGQRPGYGVADQQIDGADDGRAGDDPAVVRPEDDAGGVGRHQAHPGDDAADGDADGGDGGQFDGRHAQAPGVEAQAAGRLVPQTQDVQFPAQQPEEDEDRQGCQTHQPGVRPGGVVEAAHHPEEVAGVRSAVIMGVFA